MGRWAAYGSLAWIYFSPVNAHTVDAIKAAIRKRFPDVPQLSTMELAEWLNDSKRPAPLLIDVRKENEFAVSHLQNARNLNSISAIKSARTSNDQPIVVYCSIGYRSSAMAEKLLRAGLTNVLNLDGSIFQWANEGKPIYSGTKQTNRVHPFDSKWGKLLNPELRSCS